MTKLTTRCCRECGLPLPEGARLSADFCPERKGQNSLPCRVAWRNRRMSRGADLYDFFMNMRYNRAQAGVFGLWKMACRMAQDWHDEDVAAGRKSFYGPKEIVERHVHLKADVLVKAHKVGR